MTPQTTRADDAPSQASDPPTPQTTRADDAPSQASDPPTPQTTRADDAPSQASDPPTPQTTRADNAPLQASDPPKRVKTEQPNQTMENRVPLHEQHNYRTEIGVIRGTPSIVGPIKDQCLTLPCRVLRPERKDKEIEDVLDVCTSLDLDRAKFSLLEFLDNRLKQPGSANGIPPKWNNISNPCEIFNALQMIKTNSLDAKIHRAFGQIRLFWSVEESCTDETTVSSMRANGNHEAPHLVILEEWARKHAGPVAETEQRQKIHEYQSEYVAGRRWLEVAEWFGGPGIVLVSVCAGRWCIGVLCFLMVNVLITGIGSRYVTHGWTDFQRDCLRHISQNLHSIKQLVEALGSNALDSYCSYGFLDRGTVAKIGNVTGYLAIDVDEEDSEENGGDGNEPRRLEDGSPEVANGGDGNSESESEPED